MLLDKEHSYNTVSSLSSIFDSEYYRQHSLSAFLSHMGFNLNKRID